MVKILCIGDIVSQEGIECLERELPRLRRMYTPDLVIVNGENSAPGNGIDKAAYNAIMNAGADIVTGGNHSFQKRTATELHDDSPRLIRPANVFTDGRGEIVIDLGRCCVRVINLSGSLFMPECINPFKYMESVLKREKNAIVVVDFHAEATSEKQAMGYFIDGRASLIYGTHTHVQTADEKILSGGTGYITDIGMTGVCESVLGKEIECCVHNFRYPEDRQRIRDAKGKCEIHGIYAQIDEHTKKCIAIERI